MKPRALGCLPRMTPPREGHADLVPGAQSLGAPPELPVSTGSNKGGRHGG